MNEPCAVFMEISNVSVYEALAARTGWLPVQLIGRRLMPGTFDISTGTIVFRPCPPPVNTIFTLQDCGRAEEEKARSGL